MSWCLCTHADLYHYVITTISVQSLYRGLFCAPLCSYIITLLLILVSCHVHVYIDTKCNTFETIKCTMSVKGALETYLTNWTLLESSVV
jgi:hypothetical protein